IHTEKEKINAVDNVSFQIEKGEFVGYIGPNGAGKSTTIKMLTGILTPSSGFIRIKGLDPLKQRRENAKQIGVVFGQRTQLWWDLPVEESFDLLKTIYKIPEKQYKEKLDEFQELLGIQTFFKQQTRKLSLGQRMKADLAASLLHSPSILFLDEPTIGLDIITKEKVREFIRRINQEQKTTVLLTTHDVQDIEFLARRIIVIDRGKIGYDGNINEFNSLLSDMSQVNVHFSSPLKEELILKEPFVLKKKISEVHYQINMPKEESLSALIDILQSYNIEIQEINREKQDLEFAIKKMYSRLSEL
ncbi:MAG: ATP-binding cassette domain-containing protein, partial [Leptospiraceae bacterium]|nr:ATP-binding cassette domain-containing protein [Leptospiraceae bacterium]